MMGIDQNGLEAAVRECARITAPEVTDEEFERERAEGSSRYLKTREEMSRAIGAYLSAQQREPVWRVKELEWDNAWGYAEAKTPIGSYVVRSRRDGAFDWCLDGVCSCWASSEQSAKSAAQRDYAARILAAIEIQSSDVEARRDCSEASRRNSSEPEPSTSEAIADIAAERRRQIDVEGWTPEHDDSHSRGELACAAGCYALVAGGLMDWFRISSLKLWPWPREWFRPNNTRRALVKAGALIVAEIERIDRLAKSGRR